MSLKLKSSTRNTGQHSCPFEIEEEKKKSPFFSYDLNVNMTQINNNYLELSNRLVLGLRGKK